MTKIDNLLESLGSLICNKSVMFVYGDDLKEIIGILKRLNTRNKCDYCESIESATKNSPRKKYKYCPMCGRQLEKEIR